MHRVEQDGLRAAMHAAMRPDAASAAARDTLVRAVEQGAALVAAPLGGVDLALQVCVVACVAAACVSLLHDTQHHASFLDSSLMHGVLLREVWTVEA